MQIPGVSLYSLQVGRDGEAKAVFGDAITDLAPELKDFVDTAAVIGNLDLVVSVDTAVAHLAGALGQPVWTLLAFMPDWRWLFNRDDSPWYPSMRLFRQKTPGDWPGVIKRLSPAIIKQAASNPAPKA
jgi:ADP-heptose:LPS heptosyltransferase